MEAVTLDLPNWTRLGCVAFVVYSGATGGLNVVYRRTDGNIGWIDPVNAKKA